ncbi:hypothetical protein [Halopseudomonas pelagia]|uniref:hypothetical protein n=1 Tax=Halopseudomonas pelagia TaxID=553151 RepID=UPI001293D024|nr:hypothetical protein [Halopseudomonas pelagia]
MNIKTIYMLTILLPGMVSAQVVSADTSLEHADHGAHPEQSHPPLDAHSQH